VPSEAALQGYFTHRWVSTCARTDVGSWWDEILEGGVPADAAVMSWPGCRARSPRPPPGTIRCCRRTPLYLDSRQGRSPREPPGRGQVETLADVYHFDPLPGPLSGEQQHVLGLQANLWTEHVRTEERAAYRPGARRRARRGGWSPARG